MEQFFLDENKISLNNETIEICMNDTIMEEDFEENLNVQIENPTMVNEGSKNEEKESEQVMKINLKKLHVQKKKTYKENIFMLGANSSLGGTSKNHLKEWLKNQK
jgi:Pyruvate/2-oxoacid:ferredoxin oxidoreductase gamma subunit